MSECVRDYTHYIHIHTTYLSTGYGPTVSNHYLDLSCERVYKDTRVKRDVRERGRRSGCDRGVVARAYAPNNHTYNFKIYFIVI